VKKTIGYQLVVCACFLLTPSAWATWSVISTGNATGIGNPSCAPVSNNLVVCAVQSGTYSLMVNQFDGTKWSKWTSLAGGINSTPSCTSDGAGNVFCAATAGGSLLVTTFNGTKWSAPTKVKASLYSAPSCAQYQTGHVLCVARNVNGGLAWSLFHGKSWGKFGKLSTSAVSAPSCTTDNNKGVICAIFTTGNNTLVNRFAAGKWNVFLNLGGLAGGEPDCTSLDSNGSVACYAKAWNSGIFVSVFDGGSWANSSWSKYVSLGGSVNDNASCTAQAAGEQVCGAIGVDNAFYADVFNGSQWSNWAKVGGTGVGSPSCAPLGTGQVVCVFTGANNQLTSAVGP